MNLYQLATQSGYSRCQLIRFKKRGLIKAGRLSDPEYTSRLIPLLRVRRQINHKGRGKFLYGRAA